MSAAVSELQPRKEQFAPLKDAKSIAAVLRHPAMISQFQQALPKHLSVERMLRVCMMAVQRTPQLADCDIWTLARSMLTLASLGMEPNTPLGHAYLIPFAKRGKVAGKWQQVGTEVNVIIGYRGFIDLARRTGTLVSLHADVVYDGDQFDFWYGTGAHLKHVPGAKRGAPVWAYCHAQLTDGQAFEVRPYADVLKIRDAAQGYQSALRGRDDGDRGRRAFETTPWVAFEREMVCKTMVRSIAKMLPMSIELANAVAIDGMSEAGKLDLSAIDLSGAVDLESVVGDAALSHEVNFGTGDLAGSNAPAEADTVQTVQAKPAAAERAAQTAKRDSAPAAKADAHSSAAPAPEFEAYLVDEVGEIAGDALTDPLAFANAIEHMFDTAFPADRDAIIANNEEAMELAASLSAPAAAIIRSLSSPQPASGGSTPAPEPRAAAFTVPAVPVERGKPSFGAWNTLVRDEAARITTSDALVAFIDALAPEIVQAPAAGRALVVKTLFSRCTEMGIDPPSSLSKAMVAKSAEPQPQPDAGDQGDVETPNEADGKWVRGILQEIERRQGSKADLDALAAEPDVKDRMAVLRVRNVSMFKDVDGAFTAAYQAMRAGA
jgi:recombination protein RecT